MKLTRTILCLAAAALAVEAQAPRPRMVCLFLDVSSPDLSAQSSVRESAIQYVQQLIAPSDIVEVMTYSSRLNVVQDFTSDQDRLIGALKTIEPATPNNVATGSAPANDDAGHGEVQAIQGAVSSLLRFPEKKTIVYFSAGNPKGSLDSSDDIKDEVNAAMRANVAIYSVEVPNPSAQKH
ncbi:MAG TPA: VWA domain-containing protein [Bryobacteraceae bacterium]